MAEVCCGTTNVPCACAAVTPPINMADTNKASTLVRSCDFCLVFIVKPEGKKVLLGSGPAPTRGYSIATRLEVKARDDGYDFRRAHLGLTTADRGHFRFGKSLSPGALLQGVNHDPEIGIGQNTRNGAKGRNGRVGIYQIADHLIRRLTRKEAGRRVAGKRAQGIGRRNRHIERWRTAATPNNGFSHIELSQIPVKAQCLVVILPDFDESGFDMHLGRRHVQHLNGFFDGVQLLRSRVDEQHTQPVIKENALWWIQIQTQRREETFGCKADVHCCISCCHIRQSTATLTATATAAAAAAAAALAAVARGTS